jgi:hypothetical protein
MATQIIGPCELFSISPAIAVAACLISALAKSMEAPSVKMSIKLKNLPRFCSVGLKPTDIDDYNII